MLYYGLRTCDELCNESMVLYFPGIRANEAHMINNDNGQPAAGEPASPQTAFPRTPAAGWDPRRPAARPKSHHPPTLSECGDQAGTQALPPPLQCQPPSRHSCAQAGPQPVSPVLPPDPFPARPLPWLGRACLLGGHPPAGRRGLPPTPVQGQHPRPAELVHASAVGRPPRSPPNSVDGSLPNPFQGGPLPPEPPQSHHRAATEQEGRPGAAPCRGGLCNQKRNGGNKSQTSRGSQLSLGNLCANGTALGIFHLVRSPQLLFKCNSPYGSAAPHGDGRGDEEAALSPHGLPARPRAVRGAGNAGPAGRRVPPHPSPTARDTRDPSPPPPSPARSSPPPSPG